ncbi:MAG: HEAT repeat domain-containing protein [Candidatus Methanofastidiosia archaeon]
MVKLSIPKLKRGGIAVGFYDLSKEKRKKLVLKIEQEIAHDLKSGKLESIKRYASDDDTYIRKNTYLILGRLYRDQQDLREKILRSLKDLLSEKDEKIRQTMVYTLSEIGKIDAGEVLGLLEVSLSDEHHSVRNAVIGALKQMGEKNPKPTLEFAKKFLHHPDPKIRREIVHGIELRGRTHPEDILPILEELQNDPDRKVRKTIIHVLGQISYKKGCLEKVISALKTWENRGLVEKALREILYIHKQNERYSAKSYKEAEEYIEQQFKK